MPPFWTKAATKLWIWPLSPSCHVWLHAHTPWYAKLLWSELKTPEMFTLSLRVFENIFIRLLHEYYLSLSRSSEHIWFSHCMGDERGSVRVCVCARVRACVFTRTCWEVGPWVTCSKTFPLLLRKKKSVITHTLRNRLDIKNIPHLLTLRLASMHS